MNVLEGISASPGIAIGRAYLVDSDELVISERRIREEDVPKELERFQEALSKTRLEIVEIRERIAKEMGKPYAAIFDAHLLVIDDKTLIEEVASGIQEGKESAETVFFRVLKNYALAFSKIDDEYLRERISDIQDVGRRVLRNLIGVTRSNLNDIQERVILVAYDLSPSDTAMMHKKNVIGFVTDIGGKTSHTAIMARSLEVPAVTGLANATSVIKNGDFLVINGQRGVVIINPDEETVEEYRQEQHRYEESGKKLLRLKDLPCVTTDGHRVQLASNIELPQEVASVLMHGSEGVGLYRTEFLFMNRQDLPSEEEQYQAYRYVTEQIKPHPVIIRTLDLGGDKFLSQLDTPPEMNPFLGWRAIRFCLARPHVFKTQLRAILRASAHGLIKVMYPMISGLDELKQANALLQEVQNELKHQRILFDEKMEVGAMIEIPSAALISDILAEEVDFFSIGTNDLIQYSIAVDRVNEKIAYLYQPTHPAVLRLLNLIVENGHKKNIWVGMCGEMTADPELTLLLLGLGLNEISSSAVMLPVIKQIIRSVSFKSAREIFLKCLLMKTADEVMSYARQRTSEIVSIESISVPGKTSGRHDRSVRGKKEHK